MSNILVVGNTFIVKMVYSYHVCQHLIVIQLLKQVSFSQGGQDIQKQFLSVQINPFDRHYLNEK